MTHRGSKLASNEKRWRLYAENWKGLGRKPLWSTSEWYLSLAGNKEKRGKFWSVYPVPAQDSNFPKCESGWVSSRIRSYLAVRRETCNAFAG
jgi:hypothetical protein